MIKKVICLVTCATMLALFSGCANGPIRNWFQGAACNTCQPPVGQPIGCGTNYAPSCDSGACGTGVGSNPVVNGPAVNGPFIEAPGFVPQGSTEPYYSGSATPTTNTSGYIGQSDVQYPSSEVYGSNINGGIVVPPSLKDRIFRGLGSRN